MAVVTDVALHERLASHSAYFNSLVQLVPAKFYLPDNDEDKGGKFYKNRKKAAPKQAVKDASRKAKKRRLDPSNAKSVLDLQEQEGKGRSTSDKSDSEDEDMGIDGNEGSFSVERVPSGKIGDLRAKLHERIELLQGKRKISSSSKKHSERPKKKAKSEIKVDKKKLNQIAQSKDQKDKDSHQSAEKKVVNDKGEVVFSKFDFLDGAKNPKQGNKVRNYKKLLAQAETRKKKIEDLKEKDAGKAREIHEKHAWKSALQKADGVKPKDDPKLLKKSIKRKEKQKDKSKKQWNERKDQQKKQMDDKQKLRQKHLKERADGKKGKKGGKGKNKKHRPGF